MKTSKLRAFMIGLVLVLGVVLVMPTLLPERYLAKLPESVAGNRISLGLDLKGGAYILLEADLDSAMREKYAELKSSVRQALRGDEGKVLPYRSISGGAGTVSFSLVDPGDFREFGNRLSRLDPDAVVSRDGSGLRVAYPDSVVVRMRAETLAAAIEIIRRRVDALGNKEVSIQRQGDRRIMVQIPGVESPEDVKRLVGKTAKMSFHLVNEEAMQSGRPSVDDMVVDGVIMKKRAAVAGETLTDSRVAYDGGEIAVTTTFNAAGAKAFAKLTSENVGRRFAIVLDGRLISAPRINDAILGGRGQITGGFTTQSANELSVQLRSGALPAELAVVEERTVGAGLGADSIAMGEKASLIGMALVFVSVFLAYGVFGLFTDLALAFNILLIFAGMALFGATLTLPGIAGIALNIGMAVDANVLILERVREELKDGAPPIRAVDSGFSGAFSAIIDSNLTSLASGLIMLQFGSGPIKGFAITLILGIISSLFTNITCFRFLINAWLRGSRSRSMDL
ncbi:MAG: protein translocase subunit SecD [Rickettsiales bacterium]|nr:protein translocase subunit SecD [Rickettsiales bacterium]